MGFKSLFPSFNRDEVTPSETDVNPDVESRIGRTLARLQAFSNVLSVFKFLRSDYNGRLHITNAPTDFDNFNAGSVAYNGSVQPLVPPNPDRQEIWINNVSSQTVALRITQGGVSLFSFNMSPFEFITLTGVTMELDVFAPAVGGGATFLEF